MASGYDIFISYRRFDAEGRTGGRDIARTLKLELEKRGYKVFFDYSDIKDDDFEKVILPSIQQSKVFILVLSKDALNRCVHEGDWVRREIETAIRSGCKLVPISPDGAFAGWPDNLPDSIIPLTRQQISEVSMGPLFEKSIDKMEEDRFSGTFDSKDTPRRLHSLTFFALYCVLGFICCYLCVKSFRLMFDMPGVMIWVMIVSFFVLLSIGLERISSTINPKRTVEHRLREYLMGLFVAIVYGIMFTVPCLTHALYFGFCSKDEIQTDIQTTRHYLQFVENQDSLDMIAGQLSSIEREMAYGQFNTNSKADLLRVDSVLVSGYRAINSCPDVHFDNIEDEIRFSADETGTRISDLMNVFDVWKRQFIRGFSKEFLLSLLIALLLSISSTMAFLKAFGDRS